MEDNSSTSREDEENVALTTKGKKKFKKGPKKVVLSSRMDRRRI